MSTAVALVTALGLVLVVALGAFACVRPARYRRIYPALSRACVTAMAGLLVASAALPSLGVPIWTVFAAATLNMLLFGLLWLRRPTRESRRTGLRD